jgi:hypothetical protein
MADSKTQKEQKEQRHPQYTKDRQTLNELLNQSLNQSQPSNRNYADLARLIIRYQGFIGAKDIQADLLKILQSWQMSQEELFAKTRAIHAVGKVYMAQDEGQDDWA